MEHWRAMTPGDSPCQRDVAFGWRRSVKTYTWRAFEAATHQLHAPSMTCAHVSRR